MERKGPPPIPFSRTEKSNPGLTFGIEIEFAVATAPVNGIDPQPQFGGEIFGMHDENRFTNDKLVGAHICKTLNDHGIPAELHGRKYPWHLKDPSSWILKSDSSICSPEPGLVYEWAAIEINSPIMHFGDDALNQVRRVCSTLKRVYRINCNRSCGLHVHVGKSMEGFSFEVVRNLMALLYTFEPQIDTIHPLHRRNNLTCPSFRERSMLARHPQVNGNSSNGLELILSKRVKSFERLKGLAEPDSTKSSKIRYYLGDPCALIDKDSPLAENRTVEFRQHKSTINGEVVAEWIEFCVRLVAFVDDASPEELYPWLRAHIGETPEKYSLMQVRTEIGISSMDHLLAQNTVKYTEGENIDQERFINAGTDDAECCYKIGHGFTDPQRSTGLTFTPIMSTDSPAQTEQQHMDSSISS